MTHFFAYILILLPPVSFFVWSWFICKDYFDAGFFRFVSSAILGVGIICYGFHLLVH